MGGVGGRVWDHNSPDVLRCELGNGAKQVEQVEQACVVRRLERRELYELPLFFLHSFDFFSLIRSNERFRGALRPEPIAK